ncbi:peptidyl-tRNA hydrolase [Candidatus Phytoplasma luffae]|uniref:Peptidyl-tRNA hydrolase n=1 Tax=Loofah witches'-broom phytoplasma TaxID=35773 RepID=A0A975IM59_LOWBP|nr:aminoacyl-tRNA hydrolase [Candidatus Phytoplasma luffae]QTX03083.1 peptidyl-tRNA hydrolase [Candidatus Phytoplasma luffae]
MKLIVGLGNPGDVYDNTPHNIGFMLVDYFVKRLTNNNLEYIKELSGLVYKYKKENISAILLKPQKYMNLSGAVIKSFCRKYKINIKDVLIIHDDIYLPEGRFKLKEKGSHGGHNGIRNIIDNLQTESFKRLKIGVGYNNLFSLEKYVLSSFSSDNLKIILNQFPIFVKILEYFVQDISLNMIFNLLNKNKL